MMGLSRRSLVKGAVLAVGGTLAGAGGALGVEGLLDRHLPLDGGYAAAADQAGLEHIGQMSVTWYVHTDEPVVAFTFDDGPGPRWTSMVLDVLDEYQVPATFFMVGEHLAAHADLVAGRLDRHEVGNHSWSHVDFAQLDTTAIRDQIGRAHETIGRLTGHEARLLRPPYGHLGGSTLLAADNLGYQIVLWSRQMHERMYRSDPQAQVRDIVNNVEPGAIVLAHDVGTPERLVALRHLADMVTGLKRRGFRFVTVSELLAAGSPATGTP